MISGIFEILESIGNFFSSIGEFVSNLFNDLVSFIKMLGSLVDQVNSLLGGLPLYFVAGIGYLLVIMILLRVLGRD